MIKSAISAAAAAVIGGAMVLLAPAPASAMPVPGFVAAAPADASMLEEVGSHGYRPRSRDRSRSYRPRSRGSYRSYDRGRHGARYRSRRPGFTYHYGGYYYANPWWLAPGIGIGVTVPVVPAVRISPHVQWCTNRWRSYDHRTDTYVPRIGVRVRCTSPYPPPW